MRHSFGFASPTPAVTTFLIIIIAAYLLFAVFGNTEIGGTVYSTLMLVPAPTVFSFELWRIVTYAFLHDAGSPMHVIFNALLLYMLGPELEDRWGEKRFIIFVMTAILLGGALVCLSFLVGISNSIVVGFSAATVGLVIAWGLTFSTHQIYLLGLIPVTGMQLVYITVGMEVIYAVSANSISSAAHFGGIIAGFIFTLGLYKPRRIRDMWRKHKMKQNLRR